MDSEFRTYLKETCESVIINEKTDPKRTFWVRPSSLPYCGLRRFLTLATHGVVEERSVNAQSLYFTSTGSSIHTTFQKVLGRGGRLIGNWKCPKCKLDRLLKKYKVCPRCGTSMTMDYRELELGHLAWKGHLDGLYIAKNGELWVVDYKTCKLQFIHQRQRAKTEWRPYVSYEEQQNHYVPLVERAIDRKIAGWMLVFLSRDDPFKQNFVYSRRMTDTKKQAINERIELISNIHKRIFKIEKAKDVSYLYQHKRCNSLADHNRLFPFDPCPFSKICFTKPEMVEQVKKTVKESEYLPLIQYMPKKIKRELYG